MNNLFEEIPNYGYDFFNVPESLPELDVPIPNVRNTLPKKINLNDFNNPKRESYFKNIREKLEQIKKK